MKRPKRIKRWRTFLLHLFPDCKWHITMTRITDALMSCFRRGEQEMMRRPQGPKVDWKSSLLALTWLWSAQCGQNGWHLSETSARWQPVPTLCPCDSTLGHETSISVFCHGRVPGAPAVHGSTLHGRTTCRPLGFHDAYSTHVDAQFQDVNLILMLYWASIGMNVIQVDAFCPLCHSSLDFSSQWHHVSSP